MKKLIIIFLIFSASLSFAQTTITVKKVTTDSIRARVDSIYIKSPMSITDTSHFHNPIYIDGKLFNGEVFWSETTNGIKYSDGAINIDSLKFINGQTIKWNEVDNTIDVPTGYGSTIQVGQEIQIKVYNNSGVLIPTGSAVYPNGSFNDFPTIGLSQTNTHEKTDKDYGLTTTEIGIGEYGMVTWFGKCHFENTTGIPYGETWNIGDQIWISPTTAGRLTNIKPEFPNYAMQIGIVFKIDATEGIIFVTGKNKSSETFNNFWNGVFRENFNFYITESGGVITGALSPANGHPDMTMIFSDGFTMLTTTPDATITLIAGTDISPQEQFVYIPKSTKNLTVSTAGFPAEEHIKVAQVVLQSAATTGINGALRNQNINDPIENTLSYQGHLSHITERIRRLNSQWESGTEAVCTIESNNVWITVSGGVVYQMHKQTFPAFDTQTGSDIHLVNHFTTPYTTISNLNTITADALGNSLTETSFSLVLWGVINKTGEASHLMINLPSGSYSKNFPQEAIDDALNYSDYTIPKLFQGVGFLIARFTFALKSGDWSLEETEDLRGKFPNTTAGGGGGGGTGATTYLGLTDTPNSFTANAFQKVNSTGIALENVLASSINVGDFNNNVNYLTSYTETDPVYSGSQASNITSTDITNLSNLSGTNTGDQDLSGYLTTETDPIYSASSAASITATDITNLSNLSGTNTGDQVIPTTYWSSATGGIHYSSGNVGIGTNNPGLAGNGINFLSGNIIEVYSSNHGRLVASGGISGRLELINRDGATNDKTLGLIVAGGIGKFRSLSDDGSATVSDNILVMDIGNGNVGIGTASPRQLLDVAGTGAIIQMDANAKIQGTVSNPNSILFYNNSTARMEFNTNYATTSLGGYDFQLNSASKFYIRGDGNVGIGTTSPNAFLQIKGNSYSKVYNSFTGLYLDNSLITAGDGVFGSGIEFSVLGTDGRKRAAIAPVQTGSDVDELGLSFHVSGSTGYNVDLIEAMRIDAYGKLGIGTTSPSVKLHVNSTTSNTELLRLDVNDGLRYTSFINYSDGTYDNAGMQFKKNSSAGQFKFSNISIDIMTLLASGNVGIGTTSPNEKLEINGGGIKVVDNNYDAWLIRHERTDASQVGGIKTHASSGMSLWTNNGERVRIDVSGNVGIGTTSPDQMLGIYGSAPTIQLRSNTANATNSGTIILSENDQNYGAFITYNGSGNYLYIGTTNAGTNTNQISIVRSSGATTFASTVTASNFILSSDRRLKKNIKPINAPKIDDVEIVQFNYKNDTTDRKRYGVIAQELQKTNPEMVYTTDEGFLQVAYIDYLMAKIASLENRIKKLENNEK